MHTGPGDAEAYGQWVFTAAQKAALAELRNALGVKA